MQVFPNLVKSEIFEYIGSCQQLVKADQSRDRLSLISSFPVPRGRAEERNKKGKVVRPLSLEATPVLIIINIYKMYILYIKYLYTETKFEKVDTKQSQGLRGVW